MNNIQESGINFDFQAPQWNVVKYDEHLAHKKVSKALHPTKAVDFLGVYKNERLFLIEVKNYRGHTRDGKTQEVLQAGGEEQINQLLLDERKKIVIIACIELDTASDKEYKAQMSVWMQKLKQKLAWLHAVKISINSVENISAILPDIKVSFV